jgi:hypothetical protein
MREKGVNLATSGEGGEHCWVDFFELGASVQCHGLDLSLEVECDKGRAFKIGLLLKMYNERVQTR